MHIVKKYAILFNNTKKVSTIKITYLFESTSIDYNKDSEEAYTFFKIVQNKLHYAISGHTAAELMNII